MKRKVISLVWDLLNLRVEHSGRDDLDTEEKLSPKFKRYMQSQKDVRGKKVQLTAKCRHEEVQE